MTDIERVATRISMGELERRWTAVRREMAARGIDALVMQNASDSLGGYVKWVTDVPAHNDYPRTVIFHRDDLMTLVEMGALGRRDRLDGKDLAYLVSKAAYKDFQIRAEFWVDDEANSGIFLRCDQSEKIDAKICYEVNIFDKRPDPTYGTGAIVDTAKVDPMPKAVGKWNTYEVTAKGRDITVVLNGETTAKLRNGMFDEGPIALQHGAGAIKFRKVEVKPL